MLGNRSVANCNINANSLLDFPLNMQRQRGLTPEKRRVSIEKQPITLQLEVTSPFGLAGAAALGANAALTLTYIIVSGVYGACHHCWFIRHHMIIGILYCHFILAFFWSCRWSFYILSYSFTFFYILLYSFIFFYILQEWNH